MSRLGEGATVRYAIPEDYWNPNEGGGPIRRSSGVVTRQESGTGEYVRRTPHQVIWDAGPGGAYEPHLWTSKFLPDGRVVPADASDRVISGDSALAGAFGGLRDYQIPSDYKLAQHLALGGSALFGTILGASLRPGARLRGGGLGLLLGAIGGTILISVGHLARPLVTVPVTSTPAR